MTDQSNDTVVTKPSVTHEVEVLRGERAFTCERLIKLARADWRAAKKMWATAGAAMFLLIASITAPSSYGAWADVASFCWVFLLSYLLVGTVKMRIKLEDEMAQWLEYLLWIISEQQAKDPEYHFTPGQGDL